MTTYKTTTDMPASVIIPGFIAVMIIVTAVTGYKSIGEMEGSPATIVAFIGPVLLTVMLVAFWLYRPEAVTLTDEAVVVDRKISKISIPYSDIAQIILPEAKDMRFAVRTFGNGGLFGYTGKYFKQPYGSMTWYCSQRKNYVLLETSAGKKIVVTPDERDAMVDELTSKINATK
ncbi:MAG: hypothetical protein JNM41_09335 [Flavipsychrobacter sp.]|nr:hypothetical protein [Flavipsychrobacter sp.]